MFMKPTLEWKVYARPADYRTTEKEMIARAEAVAAGRAAECAWLLEHPSLYTAGTSASDSELLSPTLPVYATGRGGKYTYHGPGQRILYAVIDLRSRKLSVRSYVHRLEEVLKKTLAGFGLKGDPHPGRIGLWIRRQDGTEAKIAAIGIRVRRGVTFHGAALNVAPDLSLFKGIIPCGLSQFPVTSLREEGIHTDMDTVDDYLKAAFEEVFEKPGQAASSRSPRSLNNS